MDIEDETSERRYTVNDGEAVHRPSNTNNGHQRFDGLELVIGYIGWDSRGSTYWNA